MMNVTSFIAENWYLIILGICAVVVTVVFVIEFIGYPTEKKKEIIKKVLLYYVTEAEKELGGGTGPIKLSKVYDIFVKTFPHVAKWYSYESFSALVDEVLPTMREILEKTGK